MKSKILYSLFILFILNIYSQTNISAPFVSKLTFEVSNNKILLKWQNPVNFNDNLSVYRSNEIIDTRDRLAKSEKIALLTGKEEKYIDQPKDFGNYFYAVIITNRSTKEEQSILISYRNYTFAPAVILKSDFFKITKFNASSINSYNKLEWDFQKESNNNIKINIYRNTVLINNETILDASIKIATLDIDTKLYIDVPIANIPYYYAIFIEGDNNKTFVQDVNISSKPLVVFAKEEILNNFSIDNFIPLPLLALKNDPESGKFFADPQILTNPKKVQYDDNLKKIINNDKTKYSTLFNTYSKESQKKLQILNFHTLNNEEIYEPKEYKLEYTSAINFIKNKDYNSALKIFEEMKNNILPDDLLERISYYIGIIYYSKADFYESYIYLVFSYDKFKNEVYPYLASIEQNIFSKLER